MRTGFRVLIAVASVGAAVALAGLVYVKTTGLRAQPVPGRLETRVARAIRALAVPRDIKALTSPLAPSVEALWAGLEHYARYCALCHGNDGSGQGTPLGDGLFPKPPDLGAAATQGLTDGEIYYIIENGVRFTGMPAFGTGTADPEEEDLVWQLVSFIRHLPRITDDELGAMEGLNPL